MSDTRVTVFLTIGRNNANHEPMVQEDWDNFCHALRLRAEARNAEILGIFSGSGDWDGQTEESYGILVSVPDLLVDNLHRSLVTLAAVWGQDSIGCTIHDHETYGLSYVDHA